MGAFCAKPPRALRLLTMAAELKGGDVIKVCPMPDVALTVESRTLAAPARPPSADKDDIKGYNAKMLKKMQDSFQKVVQAKSSDMVEVTISPGEGRGGTTGRCAVVPARKACSAKLLD